MADFTAVRTALAAQIQANCVPPLTATARALDQITPPVAIVLPAKSNPVKYGITLGEGITLDGTQPYAPADFNIDVLLIVSHASTIERVQQTLDQWLGFEKSGLGTATVTSVSMAIGMDPTLGGTVDYAEADAVTSYGPVEYNGTMYFGARISCNASTQ